jgi:DNA modification methylase
MVLSYKTRFGKFYNSKIEDFIKSKEFKKLNGKVDLIFTSPPFPLNRKKKYGNYQGKEYIEWLSDVCSSLSELLSPTGSLVIEVGNSWDEGVPLMSTLSLE